ncbi:MAG: hypothetical protein LBJ17_07950 [Dysgonamonadaceae bacterium]|jgi:hypothetical protein|nr:hypothetical protein [Dysgonamonadaceae bacterium]
MATNSKIEAGINTYVGNFNDLIGILIEIGCLYKPQNELITIPVLQEQSSLIRMAINSVDDFQAEWIISESDRQIAFEPLKPLATRVLAMATTFNLPPVKMTHIKELVKKIRGARIRPIPVEPENSSDDPSKHISVSQTSFKEQIEHITQLIDLLAHIPTYLPVEYDLTVTGLGDYRDRMGEVNDAAVQSHLLLTNARAHRNRLLYTPVTGMMDTALHVKEYIKAVFGATSEIYKRVHHIKFANKKIPK